MFDESVPDENLVTLISCIYVCMYMGSTSLLSYIKRRLRILMQRRNRSDDVRPSLSKDDQDVQTDDVDDLW